MARPPGHYAGGRRERPGRWCRSAACRDHRAVVQEGIADRAVPVYRHSRLARGVRKLASWSTSACCRSRECPRWYVMGDELAEQWPSRGDAGIVAALGEQSAVAGTLLPPRRIRNSSSAVNAATCGNSRLYLLLISSEGASTLRAGQLDAAGGCQAVIPGDGRVRDERPWPILLRDAVPRNAATGHRLHRPNVHGDVLRNMSGRSACPSCAQRRFPGRRLPGWCYLCGAV